MKSPLFKLLGMLSWLITALASINIGACVAFQFDFFKTPFVQTNLAWLTAPAYYVIGLAGLMSLIMFLMAMMGMCGCGCHEKSGLCPSCGSSKTPPPFVS